jgi:hypothetical protein
MSNAYRVPAVDLSLPRSAPSWWHRLAHRLGWNRCVVVTEWYDDYAIGVGHVCVTCGVRKLDYVRDVNSMEIVWSAPDASLGLGLSGKRIVARIHKQLLAEERAEQQRADDNRTPRSRR